MDSTEFDHVPLLERDSEEIITKAEDGSTSSHPRKRSVRIQNKADSEPISMASMRSRRDPFDITDEEFEKLTLYRSQISSSSGPFTFGGVFWMITSIAVLYYTQLPVVIKADERVDWFWLTLSGVMLAVCLLQAAYFIVYLSWIKKVSSDHWEKVFPPGIPIATATFLLFSLFLNMALWPVFKFLTPLILLSQFLGAITFLAIFP